MAGTKITAHFYQLMLAALKRQIVIRLDAEVRELAEKIIADEIAKLTFSAEDLLAIESGGRELVIRIQRETKGEL